jgi:hypothetical protein
MTLPESALWMAQRMRISGKLDAFIIKGTEAMKSELAAYLVTGIASSVQWPRQRCSNCLGKEF